MTAEQLKKVEYLNRAYHTEKKIKALQEVRKQRKAIKTMGYNTSFMGRNGHRKPADNNFIQVARLDGKLAECRSELHKQLDELSDIILNIPETDLKAVMMCRYVLFLTHTETAKALDYDNIRTPKRKVNAALKYITFTQS